MQKKVQDILNIHLYSVLLQLSTQAFNIYWVIDVQE